MSGAAVLATALLCVVPAEAVETFSIRITHPGTSALYQYAMPVVLTASELPASIQPVDFSRLRFYQDSDLTKPLDFWMPDVQPGVAATVWLRLPVLASGTTWITCAYVESGSGPYQATSFAGRLVAAEGVRLSLQTDPPDKETTHPSVVVAEGWMTRRRPEDEPTVNRVLVDAMWPLDPSPYATGNELENPEVWLSEDGGLTWSWPPDVATNPAWPRHNNWLVDTPPYSNNSDPDAIFLRAHSLPSGGPPVDTLRVYHRNNVAPGSNVVYIDVTSTNGAWSGVQISAYHGTNLVEVASRYVSPSVVQEADGSLRMWTTHKINDMMTTAVYSSSDGVDFSKVGDVDLGVSRNMWGPWHIDVMKAGGAYWMAGSLGPMFSGTGTMRDLYMLRSEDGVHFSLIVPTVLEPDRYGGWFYAGTYRPSMLYVPGQGLEFYVGSSATTGGAFPHGGTGRWFDAGWSPDQARPVDEAITTVFWHSARDFNHGIGQWPHPWWEVDDGEHSTTVTCANSIVTIRADSALLPRGKLDTNYARPLNHESWYRVVLAPECYASLYAAGMYGPYLDTRIGAVPPRSASYRWGSTSPAAGPSPWGDLDAFHTLRFKRMGSQGRCWWDGEEMSGSPFCVHGYESTDDAAWALVRASESNWLAVDWYFYRDAVDPEPTSCVGAVAADLVLTSGSVGPGIRWGGQWVSGSISGRWWTEPDLEDASWTVVAGFRDSDGAWIGGEPVGVGGMQGVTLTPCVAGESFSDKVFSQLAAPMAEGTHAVWVQMVAAGSTGEAVAAFKSAVPVGETQYHRQVGSVTVVPFAIYPGDLNVDGFVDAVDVAWFLECMTGPAVLYDGDLPPGCLLMPDEQGIISADFNGDHDVDQSDFAVLQRCLRGTGVLPDVNCDP